MNKGDYQTDRQASDYNTYRFIGGLSLVHAYEIEIISSWIKKIRLPENPTILDVGTGTGRILKELIKSNPKKIYALDLSSAMLTQLSKNYKKEISSGLIKPIISSSKSIPLRENSVDLTTSLHLFKHLPNPKPTIISISKTLKPRGYFIFDVLNINSIVRFNLRTCYAYSFLNIETMLLESGLRIKDIVYLNNFGETIYYYVTKNFASALYLFDKMITKANFKLGVKMIILAQKL